MKKIALISGGSRGLGASLCGHYRRSGWHVMSFSRSGSGEGHVALDFADPLGAADALARALAPVADEEWQEIVAISNAARLGPVGSLAGKAPADILDNINVNVAGGVMFMSAVLGTFSTHTGRKVLANISSGAATRAIEGWSLYCAAKAGLEHYLRCVAMEQSTLDHPFTAVNVSPGVIDTGMQAEIRSADPSDFPGRDDFVALRDEGRLRAPDDVAREIVQLVAGPLESGRRYEVER